MYRSIIFLNRKVLEGVARQNIKSFTKEFHWPSSYVINQNHFIQLSNLKKPLGNFFTIKIENYSVKKGKGKIQKPKVQLKQEEIDTIINYGEYLKGMKDSIERLKNDYNETIKLQILPSTFEDLVIKTPEGAIKLGELAQCEQKSATLYTIDLIASPEYVKPVFNAIVSSKLHSNPQLNSTTISLPIAKLTREHRENLAKTVKAKCEQALKRMREIESKAARKVKESKSGNADLRYNVAQHLNYQFELFSEEANTLKEAKIKEILQ